MGSQTDGADRDTLKATTENGIRNYQARLVDYHVRKQEGDEEIILPVQISWYSYKKRDGQTYRLKEDIGTKMKATILEHTSPFSNATASRLTSKTVLRGPTSSLSPLEADPTECRVA